MNNSDALKLLGIQPLEVPRGSNVEEQRAAFDDWQKDVVKPAWRRAALRTHPDHGGTRGLFLQAQAAFETLSKAIFRPVIAHPHGPQRRVERPDRAKRKKNDPGATRCRYCGVNRVPMVIAMFCWSCGAEYGHSAGWRPPSSGAHGWYPPPKKQKGPPIPRPGESYASYSERWQGYGMGAGVTTEEEDEDQ